MTQLLQQAPCASAPPGFPAAEIVVDPSSDFVAVMHAIARRKARVIVEHVERVTKQIDSAFGFLAAHISGRTRQFAAPQPTTRDRDGGYAGDRADGLHREAAPARAEGIAQPISSINQKQTV